MAGENLKNALPDPQLGDKLARLVQCSKNILEFGGHLVGCTVRTVDGRATCCRCGRVELEEALADLRAYIGEDPEAW